jgi:LuxR family maltose regulon positive regulatory protein
VTVQILPTKLYTPPWRPNQVSRPSLLQRLEAGTGCRLTLLSAPAGYGKSTLLAEWIHQTQLPVAWLSLDLQDNDPTRFWAYFLASLQKVQVPAISQAADNLLESLQPTLLQNYESLLDNLISAITATRQRFVLILDDFHQLSNPPILDGLFYLLENLPCAETGLHLVISTRSDPAWPLARLRIRADLNELRSRDLRFTLQEVTRFLNGAMELALSPQDVAALDSRTEGWIAGLQMAAISMTDRKDKAQFIHAFTGSHRYVLDFLLEEVLQRQPPEIKTFLLKTSILERFDRDSCNAVIANSSVSKDINQAGISSSAPGNSQAVLDYLEKNNLFLVALDDQRRWYRYHHLFADLLQNLFRQQDPEAFRQLHHTAATWFLGESDIPSALHHAFAVDDYGLAAKIIEDHALTFIGNYSLASVISLLDKFPPAMIETRPWLSLTRAWALAYSGELHTTRRLLDHLELSLDSLGETRHHNPIHGHIAALRSFLSFHDAEFSLSARYGYAALQDLDETDYQTRLLTASTMAAALRWDGRLAEASQVLRNAIDLADKYSRDYTRVRLLCTLALIEMNQAKFNQAITTLEKAIPESNGKHEASEVFPFIGQVYIRLSDIYARMHQPELAMENLLKGIDLAKKWGQANTLWEGYHYLTLQLHASGDIPGAQQALEQVMLYAKRISGKTYDQQTESIQAQIWLEEKKYPALEKWLREKGISAAHADIHFNQIELYDLLLEVLLAKGQAATALEILSKTLKLTQEAGAVSLLIGEQLYAARAHHLLGQDSEALQALSAAILLGKDSGLMTVYIKQCPTLVDLLQQLLSSGVALDFISKILDQISPSNRTVTWFGDFPGAYLAEHLSERELQVLRLLNTALAVPEIALQLHLAPSTVRSHVQHIYNKLGVHGRLEALTRAQELGLI